MDQIIAPENPRLEERGERRPKDLGHLGALRPKLAPVIEREHVRSDDHRWEGRSSGREVVQRTEKMAVAQVEPDFFFGFPNGGLE